MNIIVIDDQCDEQTKRKRGESLCQLILSLGHDCAHQTQVWQSGIVRSWNEDAISAGRQTAAAAEAFFVHANNDFAVEFARDCCSEKYLIFYSGAGRGELDRSTGLTNHCKEHTQHCICREQVTDNVDLIDWDLDGCLKAIQGRDRHFCEVLNKFDPILEAKLNLLYACLDQQSLSRFLADTADPEGWPAISNLQIPSEGSMSEPISKILLDDKGKGRTLQDIDLRKLRDGLLGY